ncbi:MAG: N-acetylmuramoyl-L-alanine amidase [Oscillospiraceae bacterium]|nr:N-acetylmuramoyl-L-alanine amidase [Oscillospiraceae bacterium]
MKRDLLLLFLCLCILAGVNWMSGGKPVSASAVPSAGGNWTLILDAGHGGEDGGASTASGHRESDINLAIVRKTQALMTFLGVEPRLIRETDVSLHSSEAETLRQKKVSDLKHRVELVRETPNALLISVHQNHFTDSRYGGAQVFFNAGDVSRQWGEDTQEILRQVLNPGNNRSAKPISDGIYLFDHISCPALLVECGFLSNGEEAALLLTDPYQRKVAMALAGAYFREIQMMPTTWEAIDNG